MSMIKKDAGLPIRSEYIAWAEFLELTGVLPERLQELMEMGWIAPRRLGSDSYLFRGPDIYRVRKLERICGDFELPVVGGTIIVDLLERIDALERTVRELNRLAEIK